MPKAATRRVLVLSIRLSKGHLRYWKGELVTQGNVNEARLALLFGKGREASIAKHVSAGRVKRVGLRWQTDLLLLSETRVKMMERDAWLLSVVHQLGLTRQTLELFDGSTATGWLTSAF